MYHRFDDIPIWTITILSVLRNALLGRLSRLYALRTLQSNHTSTPPALEHEAAAPDDAVLMVLVDLLVVSKTHQHRTALTLSLS